MATGGGPFIPDAAHAVQRHREGGDGVNWHADGNPGMGTDPTISSLSFGATTVAHASRVVP